MALNFPNSPVDEELSSQPNGVTYQWSAAKNRWNIPATASIPNKGDIVSANPPASPYEGLGWWSSITGKAYVWYDDGSSEQWVERAPPAAGVDVFDAKLGGYEDTGIHGQYLTGSLNDINANSMYYFSGQDVTEEPADFEAVDWGFICTDLMIDTGWATQRIYGINGANKWKMWMRHEEDSGWQAWELVVDGPVSPGSLIMSIHPSVTLVNYASTTKPPGAWTTVSAQLTNPDATHVGVRTLISAYQPSQLQLNYQEYLYLRATGSGQAAGIGNQATWNYHMSQYGGWAASSGGYALVPVDVSGNFDWYATSSSPGNTTLYYRILKDAEYIL